MKRPATVLLSRADVARLLSLDECIAAVEQAFHLHGDGKTPAPGILGVHTEDGGFHIKAGTLRLNRNYFAAKVNGNFAGNPERFKLPTIQGLVVLCDSESGCPLAVMDSMELTALRTAAATAVAARFLARCESRVISICGCGTQGYAQLRALTRIFQPQKVFAYDADPLAAKKFAMKFAAEGTPVETSSDLNSATRQSDICVTCTTSQKSLLSKDSVRAGTFIAAVGADHPEKNEIHPELMSSSKIVVDILEQCATIGDLHHAIETGCVQITDVHAELGEIVAGRKPGRTSEDEIIIFDSTGMALQDIAAAAVVYEKAQRMGSALTMDFAA